MPSIGVLWHCFLDQSPIKMERHFISTIKLLIFQKLKLLGNGGFNHLIT